MPDHPAPELVEKVWDALKQRCCADAKKAKRYVIMSRDDLAAALSAIPDERGQIVAWQPIETAPNNVVLVTDGGYTMAACQIDGKWFVGWESGSIFVRIDLEPTHWMHLPEGPSADAIEAGHHLQKDTPMSKAEIEMSNGQIKQLWHNHGGDQHGPNIERYYIEEKAFYRFVRDLLTKAHQRGRLEAIEEAAKLADAFDFTCLAAEIRALAERGG